MVIIIIMILLGRLESLLNFQTMVTDLTGMDLANASLLDEGTAAAEAMLISFSARKQKCKTFFVDERCHPQTIACLQTRSEGFGINVIVGDALKYDFENKHKNDLAGVLVQVISLYLLYFILMNIFLCVYIYFCHYLVSCNRW